MTSPRPQTTLLIGGSNGTSTLISILGDKSNPVNAGHVVRVATRSATKFIDPSTGGPRTWRCQEKKHLSDLVASDMLPVKVIKHVGRPDSVFVYGNNSNDTTVGGTGDQFQNSNSNDHVSSSLSPLEKAICGIGTPDNGGPADLVVLCCPVSAHLSLLRRVARALYNLDARGLLGSSPSRPPILIGTLYGAGGFDWMSRIAFFKERPSDFSGKWKRNLALFGLKAFPYLCKSLQAGEVTLHGRFPQLQVALSPSNASMRNQATRLLDRLLQNQATGKKLEFLGLSSKEELGGDGTCKDEEMVWNEVQQNNDYANNYGAGNINININTANNAKSAMMIAHQTRQHATNKGGPSGATAAIPPPAISMASSNPTSNNNNVSKSTTIPPPSPLLDLLVTPSFSDAADPNSSLAFLTCTLNSTNQILHPCILVALFRNHQNPHLSDIDGTIPWNPKTEKTVLPRFYADGAAKPEAGQLITAIAGGEMYFVIDALERLVSPRGYDPITALHGGEPVGRKVMNFLGNSPHDLGERSGLTDAAMRREWSHLHGNVSASDSNNSSNDSDSNKQGLINRENLLAFLMSYGLSHNSRLNAVLAPCTVVKDNVQDMEEGTILIKPNAQTRFFSDDVQHGLCIYLGLAELLGFDLERDMTQTLHVVRRLQRWMGKEFVLPAEQSSISSNTSAATTSSSSSLNKGDTRKIVAHAKDVAETSSPQAFGIQSIQELKQFLQLDVFGERHVERAEDRLKRSGLMSKL